MTNTEKLLLSSYITGASYIDDYWAITKENFTDKLSTLGINAIDNPKNKDKFINALVNTSLPISKDKPPKWIRINELDAVLVVDLMIDNKVKRFISLRGTESNGFYNKLAIPLYLSTRYRNFSRAFNNFKSTIHDSITDAENNPDIDEVIVCGHSYGGAMVGEFFRKQENKKYSIPIIGATFGSPGTGDFFLTNHCKKFINLVKNISGTLFDTEYKKTEPIENLYEFTNTADPVPMTRILSGNKLYGQHHKLKCGQIGHSMDGVYIDHVKKIYQKEQKESDLMFGLLKKAEEHHNTWTSEYEHALERPMTCMGDSDQRKNAGIRATSAILGETGMRSRKSQYIHTNFIGLVKQFISKISPENSEAYAEVLEEERISAIESLEIAGLIRGYQNKKKKPKIS